MYPNAPTTDFHKLLKYWKDAKICLYLGESKFLDIDTGETIMSNWVNQFDHLIPIGEKVALVQQPNTLDWIVFGIVQEPSDPV